MATKNPEWLPSLLDPKTYPHETNEIKLIQTHLSWVFLAGEFVYKIKKPVDFGFLDFTTLDKRHFFCKEEIRLNKRLCPDIYLGVVPITKRSKNEFSIGENGEVVEWAVRMKRMPEEGIMSCLINRDEITKKDIDAISNILVPFYNKAKAREDKVFLGGIDVVRENCEENFAQTKDFIGNLVKERDYEFIVKYTRDFLEKNKTLFKKRQEERYIVEGHGDLYSANICIDRKKEKIYIFDCIEFNERFRYGDVAVDIGFLAMDLDFLGLCDLSSIFIKDFQEKTGDNDLLRLMDFYKCYRAYVRAKIGCFTWASPEIDEKTKNESFNNAKRYFRLALRYAGGISKVPRLICFMGLSGTGKSTLSREFSKIEGISYYNSDYVRKEYVCGIGAETKRLEPYGKGIYSKEYTERTYRALFRLAGRHLIVGEDVVLDATFLTREKRARLKEVARASGARLILTNCICPDDTAISRMEKRLESGKDVSDGRKEIYLSQKRGFEPPTNEEADVLINLDTSSSLSESIKRLKEAINV